MSLIDTLLTRIQEVRNNILTETASLQTGGILGKITGSSGIVSSLTSGGILSNITGPTGILSTRTKFLQSRITAMNSQTTPIEKVKAFLNPETPSFVPKLIPSGGILSSIGSSSAVLPKVLPTPSQTTSTPPVAKQIMELPSAKTIPDKPSPLIYA
ncbi:MAG: hypothetical protein QW745_08825 [Thermoplasmata archaeon]